MRLIIVLFLVLINLVNCSSPTSANGDELNEEAAKVKLLKWSSEGCDNTYDPDLLENRITSLETTDGVTSITVNFSDNCCVNLDPKIKFKNDTLWLVPYDKYNGDYCLCMCCYSIKYEITGIENDNFAVYFNNEKIVISDAHYALQEPTDSIYKGEIINHTNKYGFREGIWMTFYANGNEKTSTKYPDLALYYEPEAEWSKGYYQSGKPSFYDRKDTAEAWFENGKLKSEIINYTRGDTSFERGFIKYDNGQLQQKYLERYYPTIHRSEFDSTYKNEGAISDHVYFEEYFENGQTRYSTINDTNLRWYENGQIERKLYPGGYLDYDEDGLLIKQTYHWKDPGNKGSADLQRALYIDYHNNGVIQEITFARDEYRDGGLARQSNVGYSWNWNKDYELTRSPDGWNGPYPWKDIEELKRRLKKYEF
jgi:hypothetical protein